MQERNWTSHRKKAVVFGSLLLWLTVMMPVMGTDEQVQPVRVIINGESVTFPSDPVIIEGTTMVPFRAVFERFQMSVTWHEATRTVLANNGQQTIELQIDRLTAKIDGEEQIMTVAPLIIEGSTYIPLRFVSEALDAEVKWDEATRTVSITAVASLDQPESKSAEPYTASRIESLSVKTNKARYDVELVASQLGSSKLLESTYYRSVPETKITNLAVDSKGTAYLPEDKNNEYMVNNGSNIDMIQVVLDEKRSGSSPALELNYNYHYKTKTGLEGTGIAAEFFPQLLAVHPDTGHIALAGNFSGFTELHFAVHEKTEHWGIKNYEYINAASDRSTDFLRYNAEGRLLFSDLKAKTVYIEANVGNEFNAYSLPSNGGFDWSGEKVEAVLKDKELFLLDTGNSKLYRFHLGTSRLELIWEGKDTKIDAATVYLDRFIFASDRSFFELTTDGGVIKLIDKEELYLKLPESDDPYGIARKATLSVEAMAVDHKANLIIYTKRSLYRIYL